MLFFLVLKDESKRSTPKNRTYFENDVENEEETQLDTEESDFILKNLIRNENLNNLKKENKRGMFNERQNEPLLSGESY